MAEKVQMIFEQQLKDRCTPNAIKFMVELAEGFEWDDEGYFKDPDGYNCFIDDLLLKECTQCFSTLLHRAVEGWNKKSRDNSLYKKVEIGLYCIKFIRLGYETVEYKFDDYQSSTLTPCEMAIWDCLLDGFEESKTK